MSDSSRGQAFVDWRDAENYRYLSALTRDAWAWEFLRRNGAYRDTWGRHERAGDTRDLDRAFGVLELEDPRLNATEAKLLWQGEASSFVLPLHVADARAPDQAPAVEFAMLRKQAAHYRRTRSVHHLLFLDEGRRLQLVIQGRHPGPFRLLMEAPVDLAIVRRRFWLMQRLAGLVADGRLAPSLYPPDPRSRRLTLVLRALDGWLEGASQQRIAEVVFPHRDVHADWRRPAGATLRHQVRRMIQRGRWLMEGGYLRLLR